MKQYRVSKAAEMIGVSASTLRRYTREGRIEVTLNPGGQRIYTQAQIDTFMGKSIGEQKLAFYVRSSDGDTVKMDNQTALLSKAFGAPDRVFRDKASGLNEKRVGLQSLINNAERGTFTVLAITQKDRLTRFGFDYLERLLKVYGVQIIILGEQSPKNISEELLQDFMSLLASFSGKYYRLRGYQQQSQLLTKAGEILETKEPTG